MPAWLDNAIFYEIYPQSFQDTNADGIGDLRGIINRLDYIRDLGCNAIWLNPCFDSPFTDAGYDVADYKKVAPRYGTNEDLKELFREAHSRGLRVILDLVPGHTSVQHPWFLESMKSQPNEFSNRYVWNDDIWDTFEGVQNITGCIRGISDRNGCCAVNFFSTQPALNYGFVNPSKSWQCAPDSKDALATREAIKDVMRFWLQLGCDGFRVDMAGSLVKNDGDGKETIKLWQDFRRFLDGEFPDAAIISEWGDPKKSLAGGFHMDFLLHFGPSHYLDLFRCEAPYFSRKKNGSITPFAEAYWKNYQRTNGKGLICIPSSNHDMPRISHYLDIEEEKLVFVFLLTMPGAPFLYYGDEIGMRYLEGLTSVEGGFERTGARSPMQWDHTANAGFSSASPEQLYIPMDSSPDRPTVENQSILPGSLYHEIKKLIRLRLENEPLQSNAAFRFLNAQDHQPLVYLRTGKTGSALVAINPADSSASCQIEETGFHKVLYSYHGEAVLENGRLTLPPCSATILYKSI